MEEKKKTLSDGYKPGQLGACSLFSSSTRSVLNNSINWFPQTNNKHMHVSHY